MNSGATAVDTILIEICDQRGRALLDHLESSAGQIDATPFRPVERNASPRGELDIELRKKASNATTPLPSSVSMRPPMARCSSFRSITRWSDPSFGSSRASLVVRPQQPPPFFAHCLRSAGMSTYVQQFPPSQVSRHAIGSAEQGHLFPVWIDTEIPEEPAVQDVAQATFELHCSGKHRPPEGFHNPQCLFLRCVASLRPSQIRPQRLHLFVVLASGCGTPNSEESAHPRGQDRSTSANPSSKDFVGHGLSVPVTYRSYKVNPAGCASSNQPMDHWARPTELRIRRRTALGMALRRPCNAEGSRCENAGSCKVAEGARCGSMPRSRQQGCYLRLNANTLIWKR